MGIEPGIRGIVWSYVLCGGRDLDSWKTSLYVWSRSWMEAWSCGLSCKEVAMGSRTWSKRTNAHISFPLVELYTLVADIADIWRGGSYRPWSLIDFLASANSNALLTQSHCMGLCACNQSKPKIASYGCMSRTPCQCKGCVPDNTTVIERLSCLWLTIHHLSTLLSLVTWVQRSILQFPQIGT